MVECDNNWSYCGHFYLFISSCPHFFNKKIRFSNLVIFLLKKWISKTYVDFIWNTKKIILVLGSSLFLHLFHLCYHSLSKKPFSSFCQENPSKVCKSFLQKFHPCSWSKVCESGVSFFFSFWSSVLLSNFKIPNLEMF